MANIIERDGVFILEGDNFDLKIDNNRRIYVKKKAEKTFIGIDEEVELGMSAYDKKKHLYELYNLLQNKLQLRNQQEQAR